MDYVFTTGQVFVVPQLQARKRIKKDSDRVADIFGWETRKIHEQQLASVKSYEDEWHEFRGVSRLMAWCAADVVEPPVLEKLSLLFEKEA